jgi:hypothetical protein
MQAGSGAPCSSEHLIASPALTARAERLHHHLARRLSNPGPSRQTISYVVYFKGRAKEPTGRIDIS